MKESADAPVNALHADIQHTFLSTTSMEEKSHRTYKGDAVPSRFSILTPDRTIGALQAKEMGEKQRIGESNGLFQSKVKPRRKKRKQISRRGGRQRPRQ